LIFYDHTGCSWTQCQVYDPPQWYTDKPDPGEGYRLLEKFPDEPKLGTDGFWSCHLKEWMQTATTGETQSNCAWYRRRIEPNTPEKLDSSPCASNIPKGWTALSDDDPRLASDAYWSQDAEAWVIIGDGWVEAANRDKWPAIRQVNSYVSLMSDPSSCEWVTSVGDRVRLPNGKRLGVTKEGFEVL
jgi:hypothetical protein